ncbi:rna-binding protein nova-1 [Cystoisospora suis]|uniref:Rna-binding protein nova-1 n=1 Tax=Cystoisospora suis TaxID=483139 RepID=A0A2C6LHF0_9APIC|nr:rna-binding protein nova-1 [Cystoisospora suis]
MEAPPTKRSAFQGPCYLKMVVNNLTAGAVIGKNGAAIAGIEQTTGCAVKLSPSNAFYPGTQDRVLIMSGEQEQLNNALVIILDKIKETAASSPSSHSSSNGDGRRDSFSSNDGQQKITCRLAVPKSAVSAIIGKGGQQIRELQDTTGARVQISSREEGLAERMITISGVVEHVRSAALTIAACIQSDPYLRDHMHVVYKSGAPGGVTVGGLPPASTVPPTAATHYGVMPISFGNGLYPAGAGHLYSPAADVLNIQCDITIQVADHNIGAVIGRSGSCVTEIIKATGTRIQISQKGDLVPGTNDRKIVISGTVGAVHSAHLMLLQRIHAFQEAPGVKGHPGGGPGVGMGSPGNAANNGLGDGHGLDLHVHPHSPAIGGQGNLHYMHPPGYGY